MRRPARAWILLVELIGSKLIAAIDPSQNGFAYKPVLKDTALFLSTQVKIEAFVNDSVDPHVRGFLHLPESGTGDALILTHGAGANCQSPLLIAVANAFADTGLAVLRCDLPFRQARPKGPPLGSAVQATDRAGLAQATALMRQRFAGRVVLGGHSYGGRQATMLAAERTDVADGLLLFSYPLHPPNRPSQRRDAHFPKLTLPSLFVHGARDSFGTSEEMKAALKLIPGKTTLVEIEGAGHDLAKGRGGDKYGALVTKVVEAFKTSTQRSALSIQP